MTRDAFLSRIEEFMASSGVPASRLGREAIGDPNFVLDLRAGRSPSLRTAERVERWMADYSANLTLEGSEAK